MKSRGKKYRRPCVISQEEAYDLIRRPIITEKTTLISAYNQYVFFVPLHVSKQQIKAAVERCLKVKVSAVNTLTQKGKKKMMRGRRNQEGHRSDRKKAFVTLKQGERLDITTGV